MKDSRKVNGKYELLIVISDNRWSPSALHFKEYFQKAEFNFQDLLEQNRSQFWYFVVPFKTYRWILGSNILWVSKKI